VKPLSAMPVNVLAAIRGVFTDIDDTITSEGRLEADAYGALERLKQAGLAVVPITGRPAGWCDMVARFWPVDGIVGENGAFYFAYDHKARRMRRRFMQDENTRAQGRAGLAKIATRVLKEVPGAAVASDQLYRDSDLAIDFCEDVAPLDEKAVARIVSIFHEEGAVAKVSSIHVNGWFGDYDKLTMSKIFAREVLGSELEADKADYVYCGDSPNDAPMFGFFPNACGVANVKDFIGRMEALPAYIAGQRGGAGFVEIVDAILAAGRNSASSLNHHNSLPR
jgi:HAD superfamily hydrolase (TIGR01484 family)